MWKPRKRERSVVAETPEDVVRRRGEKLKPVAINLEPGRLSAPEVAGYAHVFEAVPLVDILRQRSHFRNGYVGEDGSGGHVRTGAAAIAQIVLDGSGPLRFRKAHQVHQRVECGVGLVVPVLSSGEEVLKRVGPAGELLAIGLGVVRRIKQAAVFDEAAQGRRALSQ